MEKEPPNAIEQRLAKLTSLWMQFRERPDARICRWLLKDDEVKLVQGFIDLAQRPDHEIADLFFPLESTFSKPENYSVDLINELDERLKNEKEKTDFSIVWQPGVTPPGKSVSKHFLDNFSSFASALSTEELAVAFFNPPTWTPGLESWLIDAVSTGIPDRIRFIVLDLEAYPMFTRLADLYPEVVKTIRPELDMMSAMIQLASAGDPADPGVKFRKAFLVLSQAAAKKDLQRFEQLANEPLGIARQQGWKHLEIAVFALKGSTLLSINKFEDAISTYENGRLIAQSAADQGDPIGQTLSMQMLLCKGSVGIAMKDYKLASEQYALAGDKADEVGDQFQIMESRRMQGYCLEQLKNKQAAWAAYNLSLNAGEQLDISIRQNSTLPYVGRALLDMADTLLKKEEYFSLENRLNNLLGQGWLAKHSQTASAI
ncbi:MAG: hypothetical protein ABI761_06570 [Saprospiraceae bacterium]